MKSTGFYLLSVFLLIMFGFIFPKLSVICLFFVVFTGIYRGSSAGSSVGFLIGLANDFFAASALGIDSFSYAVVGYCAGLLPGRFDEGNPLIQTTVSFAAFVAARIIGGVMRALFVPGGEFFSFDWSVILNFLAPAAFLIFKRWWSLWFGELSPSR